MDPFLTWVGATPAWKLTLIVNAVFIWLPLAVIALWADWKE